MIAIEVINSSNPYIMGQHLNYGNLFLLGKSKRNNLIEKGVQNLRLSIQNDKLYIENVTEEIFYLVNGKKISGKKRITKGDTVSQDVLSFKILDFKYSHIDPITDTENLHKIKVKESPEIAEILELIEQEFIHLEKLKYHEK